MGTPGWVEVMCKGGTSLWLIVYTMGWILFDALVNGIFLILFWGGSICRRLHFNTVEGLYSCSSKEEVFPGSCLFVAVSFYWLGRPLQGSLMSLGFAICSSPKHPEDAPVTETARFSKTHLIFFILDHLFWLVNDSQWSPQKNARVLCALTPLPPTAASYRTVEVAALTRPWPLQGGHQSLHVLTSEFHFRDQHK